MAKLEKLSKPMLSKLQLRRSQRPRLLADAREQNARKRS